MKAILGSVIAVACFTCVTGADRILWSDIGDRVEIIGRLGVPLGTAVEIEATVVTGEMIPERHAFGHLNGRSFLRVEAVAGVELEARPIMWFYVVDDDGDLEREDSASPTTLEVGMSDSRVGKLFGGQRFRMWVYESGEMSGYPPSGELGKDLPFISRLPDPEPGPRKRFETRLNVFRAKAAQPGATDNPDDAQRLREDH